MARFGGTCPPYVLVARRVWSSERLEAKPFPFKASGFRLVGPPPRRPEATRGGEIWVWQTSFLDFLLAGCYLSAPVIKNGTRLITTGLSLLRSQLEYWNGGIMGLRPACHCEARAGRGIWSFYLLHHSNIPWPRPGLPAW